ncbi:MAG: c-type cytochrome [Myxococcota bacterium]
MRLVKAVPGICRSAILVLTGLVALVPTLPALSEGAKEADPAKGKQVYDTYCATCHGPKGDGQGPVGKGLNPPPRDFTKADFKYGGTDQDLFDVISNGAAAKGGSPLMAPWGAVISEQDRWALVAFIRSLHKQ